MSSVQQEVFGGGAEGAGQVLPHAVLQVQGVRQLSRPGWFLLEGWGVLLYCRLPTQLRHQVLSLRRLRRRGGMNIMRDDSKISYLFDNYLIILDILIYSKLHIFFIINYNYKIL